MKARHYSHPKYILWFKYIFVFFAIGRSIYLFLDIVLRNIKISGLIGMYLIIQELFVLIFVLVAIYSFQDIWADDEGLLIEFLWKKIRVEWIDLEEMKPSLFLGRGSVVLVKGLTPFHRMFGFIYRFSLKPAFIIAPTLLDGELLKNDIKTHIVINHETRKNEL